MTIISLIAAVDEANGLGKNNQLLCHLPADLQHFKALTLGKPIIMGRKTYESIGKPLPQRLNIVLSTNKHLQEAGITVLESLHQALELTKNDEEIMIIGGSEVFKVALPIADRIFLTRIHHLFDSDVFFPQIDDYEWQLVSKEIRKKDEKNQFDLSFFTYRSVKKSLSKEFSK